MIQEIFEGLDLMAMLCVVTMLLVIVAMAVDLVSGVRKAKQRGEARTSYGLSRTFNKFLIYEGMLIICACIDALIHFVVYMTTESVYLVPIVTCLIGIVLCACEGWSVYEKAEDKQRRKMAEVATAAAALVDKDTLTEIVSEAIKRAAERSGS